MTGVGACAVLYANYVLSRCSDVLRVGKQANLHTTSS